MKKEEPLEDEKDIEAEMKNYKALKKEIEPFLKKREIEFNSTAGNWHETSEFEAKEK